jgi:RimJ/RimL family protein N-acetyltransferase
MTRTVRDEDFVRIGEKVGLREKSDDDAWNDYLWRIDAELSELDAARPLTMTFEQYQPVHKEDIRYPAPRSHRFAIEDLESGTHIGNCMYYDLDTRSEEAELGIMVGDRGYWNHGYGQDAVTLLLDHLFDRLRLKRVYLKTLDWNIRAQRSFSKDGFREYGTGDQGRFKFMLMEITRPEWEALKSSSDSSTPNPN